MTPEQLLKELGIREPGDIDIEAIAQFCGATILYRPLTGCEARIIGSQNEAIITVNENAPTGRQRFSAGHELGHWVNDRGKVGFSCTTDTLFGQWSQEDPERRANRFAAELLMPSAMFGRLAKDRPITLETAQDLADRFRTSLTAAAIRLVQHGSYPSIAVCCGKEGRQWFIRGPDVPDVVWPVVTPARITIAHDLLEGRINQAASEDVAAYGWFDLEDADRYSIRESSFKATPDLVVSLLWWKDERQLVRLLDLDE